MVIFWCCLLAFVTLRRIGLSKLYVTWCSNWTIAWILQICSQSIYVISTISLNNAYLAVRNDHSTSRGPLYTEFFCLLLLFSGVTHGCHMTGNFYFLVPFVWEIKGKAPFHTFTCKNFMAWCYQLHSWMMNHCCIFCRRPLIAPWYCQFIY